MKVIVKPNVYTDLGTQATQIQVKDGSGIIGIIHADAAPADGTKPDYELNYGDGISHTLVGKNCYVTSLSVGNVEIAYDGI
jgi:hypothetical protein